MRVYKRYRYNLAPKLKFAQNFNEVETFLLKNELDYHNVLFYAYDFGLDIEKNVIGKAIKKFPELRQYLSLDSDRVDTSILSNCDKQWMPVFEDDIKQLIRTFSEKVPRPYLFKHIAVALNRISFFDEDNEQFADPKMSREYGSPLSSNIIFWKCFSSGNKYNYAFLTIDVSADESGKKIKDDSV